MGGAPAIHLSMAIYAAIIYLIVCNAITCDGDDPHTTKQEVMLYMDDIKFIFIAHVVCTVLWLVKKMLKTSKFYGAYVKVFLSNTCILLYVASFIYIYYQQMLYEKDE